MTSQTGENDGLLQRRAAARSGSGLRDGSRSRRVVHGCASPVLPLAPEWSTLTESTDISGKGLTVVEFDCEPCQFTFECTVNEGGH